MPNILTHYYSAMDILERSSESITTSIHKNTQAFLIGSSGPDIFFYYNQLPWQKNKEYGKEVRSYGSLLHQYHINDFYESCLETISNERNNKVKDAMVSFLYGHLAHWSLDTITHPYIFYMTDATTEDTQYWHFRFESMIDSMMANQVKKESINQHPFKTLMKSNDIIEEAITKLYQPVLKEYFKVSIDIDVIHKAFKDAQTVLSILHDPSGKKFKFIYRIEKNILKKPWFFSSHIVTDNVDDTHDILNIGHQEWLHPCDNTVKSNKSFLELYQESISLGLDTFKLLENSLRTNQRKIFLKQIDNRSYETGLSTYKKMKYFDSIYK